MKKIEYTTRYFGAHEMPAYSIGKFLNDMGEDGWELVHVFERFMINEPWQIANYTFVFKRQKAGAVRSETPLKKAKEAKPKTKTT